VVEDYWIINNKTMSKNSNSLVAFVIGAGVGAALGILFAPDAGNNTRDKLSFKLSKYKKELESLIEDLVEGKETHLNEAKTEGKRVISEAKNKAENLLSDVNKLIDQINQGNN
jgi:gas vesicle protein